MKKIYTFTDRKEFWKTYWKKIEKDVNELENASEYPLHLVDRYADKNKKMLELGCGLGRVLKHYHYKGYNIEGIEYDEGCVNTLRREDNTLRVRHADITNLPYSDGSFDIAMAFGIIGHLEHDMAKAFREVNRIMKQGGLLAGSLCYDNVIRLIFRLQYFLSGLGRKRKRCFYTHLFTKKEIQQILSEFGFTLLEMKPVLSREVLYRIPFLRHRGQTASRTLQRSGERYYKLTRFGEAFFNFIERFCAYQYTTAVSFLAKKERTVTR